MTTVKTIGVGAGLNVTPDYASIDLWESYLNGLGAFSEDQVGRVLWASSANEQVFSGSEILFNGSSPGAFNIILEAGDANGNAGGSFKDHPTKTANALRYDASKGSAIRHTSGGGFTNLGVLGSLDDKITIRNLQVKEEFGTRGVHLTGTGGSGNTLSNVMVEIATVVGYDIEIASLYKTAATNCMFLLSGTGSTNSKGIAHGVGDTSLTNCVVANTGAAGSKKGITQAYSTLTLTNVAVFGWNTDAQLSGGAGSNNATDKASGSSGLPATALQASLVAATEFQSVTNGSEDLRLKSTSVKCKDNGTSTGAPAADIIGQSRSASVDIGAWEFQFTAIVVAALRHNCNNRRRREGHRILRKQRIRRQRRK